MGGAEREIPHRRGVRWMNPMTNREYVGTHFGEKDLVIISYDRTVWRVNRAVEEELEEDLYIKTEEPEDELEEELHAAAVASVAPEE